MSENIQIDGINIIRVLEKFLNEPEKALTYVDFKYLREYTGESQILAALRNLARSGIIKEDTAIGRPRAGEKRRRYYRIINNPDTFKKLFAIYLDRDIEILFKSGFLDSVIQMHDLADIYDIITPYLERSEFRKAASSILKLPATETYYRKFSASVGKRVLRDNSTSENLRTEYNSNDVITRVGIEFSPRIYYPLTILAKLAPLDGVKLYRKTVYDTWLGVYKKLVDTSAGSAWFQEFLKTDSYLSPFTSFPVYSPDRIIFSRPFERIFDDIYLLKDDHFGYLVRRAYIIYTNFAEIMYESMQNRELPKKEQETELRINALHWNVASTRFDYICLALSRLHAENAGSGNYYLRTQDDMVFQIYDLVNFQPLLPADEAYSLLPLGSLPRIARQLTPYERGRVTPKLIEDPFNYLRPSIFFKMFGGKSDIVPIETVLDYVNRRRDR